MAGPLDIQRLPVGLVDLLGMKGSGDTPHALADAIAITLADGADYYLAQRRQCLQADSAAAILGTGFLVCNNGLAGPPSGEIWLMYNFTATLDAATAAATGVRFAGALSRNGVDVSLTECVNLGAAELVTVSRQFERPLVLLPTDTMGIRVTQVTGAPGARARIRYDVARLTS